MKEQGEVARPLKDLLQAAGVVVVTVGQDHRIGGGQIDPEALGVVDQYLGCLPGVEEDPLRAGFDPEGQPVLTQ